MPLRKDYDSVTVIYYNFTFSSILLSKIVLKEIKFYIQFFFWRFQGYRKKPVPFYLPMILDNFEKEEHASLNDISRIEIKTKQQLRWSYHPMDQMVCP